MSLTLDQLSACFEGVIPSVIATAAADGTPNASYLSHVVKVDDCHVALSNQFFAKTSANVRANRSAALLLVCPRTGDQFVLDLLWDHLLDEGPIFDHIDRMLRAAGGWNFDQGFTNSPNWVHAAYRRGVPMGSDLPQTGSRKAPSFAIQAVKDPRAGNLDRVQVVKVWLEGGKQKERVFDVAWSGQRKVNARTGKLSAVGNTVDLKTGKYTNAIGAAQLVTVWTDPTFEASRPAVYYLRVLEIPTPRWSTLRALEYGLPLPKEVPATLQQRAWSSPIWYTPARKPA